VRLIKDVVSAPCADDHLGLLSERPAGYMKVTSRMTDAREAIDPKKKKCIWP
jgi:hypothetical protein